MTPPCPACRATSTRPAATIRDYRFWRCRACGSLFIAEVPAAHTLDELYADEHYFANPDFDSADTGGYHGYLDYVADREHIEDKFDEVLARIERWVEPAAMLDVGAGPGFLLSVADRRGWRATGVELNPWAARYARETVGVDVREGTIETAELEPERYAAITMMDLIEHVPDPEALVAAASERLRPGGILAILTPDAGSPVSRLLGRRWPEVKRVPEHLLLYSVKGLEALLRRHDYELLDWHSIGKTSSIATLLADVSPAAPKLTAPFQRLAGSSRLAQRTFELNPRTKFCLYARRL